MRTLGNAYESLPEIMARLNAQQCFAKLDADATYSQLMAYERTLRRTPAAPAYLIHQSAAAFQQLTQAARDVLAYARSGLAKVGGDAAVEIREHIDAMETKTGRVFPYYANKFQEAAARQEEGLIAPMLVDDLRQCVTAFVNLYGVTFLALCHRPEMLAFMQWVGDGLKKIANLVVEVTTFILRATVAVAKLGVQVGSALVSGFLSAPTLFLAAGGIVVGWLAWKAHKLKKSRMASLLPLP